MKCLEKQTRRLAWKKPFLFQNGKVLVTSRFLDGVQPFSKWVKNLTNLKSPEYDQDIMKELDFLDFTFVISKSYTWTANPSATSSDNPPEITEEHEKFSK